MAHFRISHQALRRLIGQHQNPNAADRITNSLLFRAQGLRYRKLEVILTTTVENLGRAGDTVKVAPGYFRNHLMPKLLAVPNIEKFAYLVREQRKLYQREEEETAVEVSKAKDVASETSDDTGLPKVNKLKEYQTAALRLYNGSLGLRRLIKADNELRTPITKEELVAEVARQLGIFIYPENLHLPASLTMVGQYEVPLRLPRKIPRPEGMLQWTLKVKVRRKRSGDDRIFKSPSSDKIIAEAVQS